MLYPQLIYGVLPLGRDEELRAFHAKLVSSELKKVEPSRVF